jgi:Ser/Thr protein kinase RdoA (MazF antagonist)
MEKTVEVLFTNEILGRFLDCFGLDRNIKKLGDFENYVFEVFKNQSPFILRITHSSHRGLGDIEAELDWVNFLHQNGVNCPEVYQSGNDSQIETLEAVDGSRFFACLYAKAPGFEVKVNSESYNERLFHAWGKQIGKLHAVTKRYKPKKGASMRPSWHEEELLDIAMFLPAETEIIRRSNELMEELFKLPQNVDNFGLLHTDIHSGNFFFDGNEIHVFDFDDASYHWFASDLAIPLYYSLFGQNKNDSEREEFAAQFIEPFLKGYQEENPLPENLLSQIPLFLKLRDITLFAVFHKKIAPEDRSERIIYLLAEIKERILKQEPIVHL